MKSLPYREGSLFALPLRNGGYAAGLVARMAPKGKVILAYFFGRKFEAAPLLSDISSLHAIDAVKILRVGDLGLINGEWLVIGDMPSWSRAEWPVPYFVRRDDISERAWCVTYADSDPSKYEKEELIAYESSDLQLSGLYGYGAAELVITKLLG